MRKNALLRNLTMIAIMTSLLVGCSDNQSTQPFSQSHYPRVVHGPLNPSNPYDSLGIYHNMACEYLLTYVRDIDSTFALALPRIELAFENLADSLGWTDNELNTVLWNLEDYANGLDSSETFISRLMNFAAGDGITPREAIYIQEIGEAFNNASDSIGLMNAFLDIEQRMATEDWDPGEVHALETIAVAKHSFSLWWGYQDWETLDYCLNIACADADAASHIRQDFPHRDWHIAGFSMSASTRWKPGMILDFPNH